MMEERNYHVSLKRQPGEGFVAKCIELPGCLSEGKTKAEALKNIQDAIKLYLEDVEAEAKEKKAKLIKVRV
jgi:predicted RNase H-like HicB family nuclease